MVAGRFIFGVSEGAIFIALVAGLAQWFSRSGIALATALYLSLARVGSYARGHLDGVGPPSVRARLAAAPVARRGHHRARASSRRCFLLARPASPAAGSAPADCRGGERVDWRHLLNFDHVLLVHPRAARALRRGVLPVPHDLRHRVLPARQGPHPRPGRRGQQLGVLRRHLRHAASSACSPTGSATAR